MLKKYLPPAIRRPECSSIFNKVHNYRHKVRLSYKSILTHLQSAFPYQTLNPIAMIMDNRHYRKEWNKVGAKL